MVRVRCMSSRGMHSRASALDPVSPGPCWACHHASAKVLAHCLSLDVGVSVPKEACLLSPPQIPELMVHVNPAASGTSDRQQSIPSCNCWNHIHSMSGSPPALGKMHLSQAAAVWYALPACSTWNHQSPSGNAWMHRNSLVPWA